MFFSVDVAEMEPELARIATAGFTGCLSAVRFNTITPLKAGLLHPDTSPTTISGPLVQSSCGSSSGSSPAAESTHHLSGPNTILTTHLNMF